MVHRMKNFFITPFYVASVIFSLGVSSAQLTSSDDFQQGLRLGQAKEYLRARSEVSYWGTNVDFLAPLVSLQNSYAEFSNDFSRSDINAFMKGRHHMQQVTDDDMLYLGPLLLEDNSPLLKQLSISQAFVLWRINQPQFRRLSLQGFGNKTSRAACLFLHVLDKNESDQSKALEDDAVKALLMANCIVLKELLKVIPRHSESYVKMLDLLKSTPQPAHDVVSLKKTFDYPFDQVTIQTEKYSWTVDAQTIYFMSDRIRDLMDESQDEAIDLSSRADAFMDMLANFYNKKPLLFKKENILLILDTARYFGIKDLAAQSDKFIHQNDLLKDLVIAWLESDNDHYDAESISMQWHFCDRYKLKDTKKILGQKLLEKVNNLCLGDDRTIKEILGVCDQDRNEILKNVDFSLFHIKLKDCAFFAWAWDACQYIRPLRKSIEFFCAEACNKDYLDAIHTILPKNIAFELAMFRTYKCRKTLQN